MNSQPIPDFSGSPSIQSGLIPVLHRFADSACVVAIIIGMLALGGWIADIDLFISVLPGLATMNPTTALCFIVISSSMCLLFRPSFPQRLQRAARIGAVFVSAVGLIKLLDYFTLWDSGIDRFLFTVADQASAKAGTSRMAPFSAVNFVCLGLGVLVVDTETARGYRPAQLFGLFVAVSSSLILIGYAFSLLSFSVPATRFISMALNSAATFVLLGLALLHAHSDRGLMATITSSHLGSYMLRRLLPVAVGLPLVLGWLRVAGQQADLFTLEVGATLYTISTIVVISALTWHIARSLNRTDIRRHAAEEELRRANTDLRRANELKTDLLHIAAHDMKNPLGAIRSMAELIRSAPDDKALTQDMSNMIYTSSNHMLGLIDELLRTAALDSGTIQLNREPVDMRFLVSIVAAANAQQAQCKDQRFIVQADDNCTVEGDGSRLREVLDNLVSNAVKYSPAGKSIYITLSRYDDLVRLVVRDEGPGLTQQDMSKLFGKFQRLRSRPTGGESSTGLGLSIVKQLVELHGGSVRAESDGENTGTAFIVDLPFAGGASPAPEAAQRDTSSGDTVARDRQEQSIRPL